MSKAKRKAKVASADDESPSFEAALDELEATVERLESGEMPLEEALELFEAGVRLSRQCNQTLSAAERRIEILIADRTEAEGETADFDFEDDALEDEDGDED